MRKSTIVVILALILAGWLLTCLSCILIGPRLYNNWWQSFEITDHDFPLQQQWCYEADRNIRSTPIEYDGRVVIRTDQELYVLDATTGNLLWSISLPQTWHAAPPIVRGGILVVTHTKGTSAFDLTTGQRLWLATDNSSRTVTFPSAANDQLVVIVGAFIAGRDIRTGELLWRINRLYPRTGAIAAMDESYLYIVFPDQIRTYDVKTGELIHTNLTEDWSLQSWLFQDDIWYLERAEGGISAFSMKEQKMLWRRDDFELADYLITKHRDMLLIGLWSGQPVALNAKTGETIWYANGVVTDTYETPVVMGETVYVRSLSKKILYALNLETGDVIGYLEIGRPVLASSNADYSLGPIQAGASIVFAADHRLCAYGP
ncbi:MAG: PQQ-binding-like beta-propeller repeat protein [Anaerolineae bacterium]|jgi:outer membrane protein assembly factor BamB